MYCDTLGATPNPTPNNSAIPSTGYCTKYHKRATNSNKTNVIFARAFYRRRMIALVAACCVGVSGPLELLTLAKQQHASGNSSAATATLRRATRLAPSFGLAYFELANFLVDASVASGSQHDALEDKSAEAENMVSRC